MVLAGPADHSAWLAVGEITRASDGDPRTAPPLTPLPGTGLGIIDFCDNSALPGALGRLCLSSGNGALGYAGRAGATADAFRPRPEGRRTRRTADLVRRPRTGQLLPEGRADRLLSAAGRLVDPTEVEEALRTHPDVEAAAVVADANAELVAFHAPGTAEPEQLTAHLRTLLSAHALPSRLEPLDQLPRTASGDIARSVLTAAAATRRGSGPTAGVRPRTHLERALLDCFRTALGRDDIGVFEDFFDVGGTSLTAARLITALPEAVGYPVPLKLLFQESTVAGLAAALESPDGPGGRESAVQLALRDERLAPDIAPDPDAPARPRPEDGRGLGRVLLTGVTGFLGPHLAAELLAQGAQEIICLIRGEDPHGRLEANLRRFDLDVDRDRLTVLPGDLTLPLLGLAPEAFAELADRVDAIYHCGAVMNFILPYRALRAPNVLGTQEILRLACLGRPSPVHYISTIDMRVGDALPEAAGPLDSGTEDGYVLSKKTAEHLVLEAGRRGLPVGVYRPWLITGAVRTGAVGVRDQLALCLAGSLIAGVMPEATPLPLHVLPVDQISEVVVRLSRLAPRPNPVHQFYNPQIAPMESVHQYLSTTGYPLRTAPFDDWRVQLARRTAGRLDGLAALLTIEAPTNGDPDEVGIGNTLSGVGGDPGFPPISVEYVQRTVDFLVREGLVPELPATTGEAVR